MSSAQHDTFSPYNLTILGGLLFTALILGEVVFSRNNVDTSPTYTVGTVDDINNRLRPVVTLDDIMANAGAAGAGDAADKTPAQLYTGACLACHASGVAGAPKLGDSAAWKDRMANGMDSMVSSAMNGIGAMPPKGGSTYSEEQLRQVVEYMLSESGF